MNTFGGPPEMDGKAESTNQMWCLSLTRPYDKKVILLPFNQQF